MKLETLKPGEKFSLPELGPEYSGEVLSQGSMGTRVRWDRTTERSMTVIDKHTHETKVVTIRTQQQPEIISSDCEVVRA